MCGHVGVLSQSIMKNHVNFFEQALFVDQLRGDHGTGVAFFDRDFNVRSLKKAMGALDFLDLNAYRDLSKKSAFISKFIMGHNRYATKGGISNKTSHPFTHGDIIMSHNGSLSNQKHLIDWKDFDVDSENIAHSLNIAGIDETIKNLAGSYSLVWANTTDKTVNFIRNKERPMIFGLSKNKKTLLYASEQPMLEWLAWRNGIELESVSSTEVDTLYTFNMEAGGEIAPTTREIKGRQPLLSTTYSKNNNVSYFRKNKNRVLASLGIEVGETIHFTVNSFKPYRGTPKRGILNGTVNGDLWTDIIIYSFYNKDNLRAGDLAKGDIVSAVIPSTKPPLDYIDTLILSEKTIVADTVIKNTCNDEDDLGEIYDGPDGSKVSFQEFTKLTKFGCSSCAGNILHSEHKEISWHNRFTPFCQKCTEENNFVNR